MIQKQKTDSALGEIVHAHLLSLGLESPFNFNALTVPAGERVEAIESRMREILDFLGIDQTNDSVRDTAKRVAKMWVNEVMWGMDYSNFPKIMTFENKMGYNEMVTERATSNSLCSHHLAPILGTVVVSYIPDKKVIGLSKLGRIAEFFSRRPQEAERMTEQIAATLKLILGTENVAVFVKGVHTCVTWRGVEDSEGITTTAHLGGVYQQASVRSEFLTTAMHLLENR